MLTSFFASASVTLVCVYSWIANENFSRDFQQNIVKIYFRESVFSSDFPGGPVRGLCASTAGGLGLGPSWGGGIPQAAWCSQKETAFFPKLERKLFGSAFTLAIMFIPYLPLPSHPPESYKLDLSNLHTHKFLSFSYQWVILSLFWITETCENLINAVWSPFLGTEKELRPEILQRS